MPKPVGLILAGGKSRRLFPVQLPKPLLEVAGSTLLEQAIRRLKGFDVYVVTNAAVANQIRKVFRKKKKAIPKFILEPEPRDTAAAVGFALRKLKGKKIPWIAVLSADQYFPTSEKFQSFMNTVQTEIAKNPQSLFVGGSPLEHKKPESYSHFGWMLSGSASSQASLQVSRFVEKPTGSVLDEMIQKQGLINAGMFFGTFEIFQKLFEQFYPEIFRTKLIYKKLPTQPIDRAIVEKYNQVRVIPLADRWEDLGTWADWKAHSQTQKINAVDSEGCYVFSGSPIEVFIFGVENLAVIYDQGKLMIVPVEKSRDLKGYLDRVERRGK